MKVVLIEPADLKDPFANEAVIKIVRKQKQGGQMYLTDKAKEILGVNEMDNRISFAYVAPEGQTSDVKAHMGAIRATSSETFEMLNLKTKNKNKVTAPKVHAETNGMTSATIHDAICSILGINPNVVEGEDTQHIVRLTPVEGGYATLSLAVIEKQAE